MFRSLTIFTLFAFLSLQIFASPASPNGNRIALERRTDPYFPDTPASCPICQKDYASINSCAQAAPVLANFTMIIFNPGAFIDVIKCACAETFQAVFPQCVDCFIRTGQQNVLNNTNLPSIVSDIRNICALQSTLLGNVTDTNSNPPPTSSGSLTREVGLLIGTMISILGVVFANGWFGF